MKRKYISDDKYFNTTIDWDYQVKGQDHNKPLLQV